MAWRLASSRRVKKTSNGRGGGTQNVCFVYVSHLSPVEITEWEANRQTGHSKTVELYRRGNKRFRWHIIDILNIQALSRNRRDLLTHYIKHRCTVRTCNESHDAALGTLDGCEKHRCHWQFNTHYAFCMDAYKFYSRFVFLVNLLAPELFFFLILAHPVFKIWITQEPNKLELWNKLHFEDKKPRVYTVFKIFSTYICWINI